ncbi:MAG: hypothetical protein JNJ64_14760 [Flavobacteriales bacterium]|nr:hypothetical protein [Flavobacteriales bacterium]
MTLSTALRQLALAATLCTAAAAHAEEARILRIDGKVLSSEALTGATLTVLQDGAAFTRMEQGLAQFQLNLPLGHEYRLSFERPGTIAKELVFDTRLPGDVQPRKDFLFHFQVSLLAQPAEGPMRYDGPVGLIAFNSKEGDFGYEHLRTARLVPAESPAAAPAKRVRREAAPFVDPTMELAAWVETQRAEAKQ